MSQIAADGVPVKFMAAVRDFTEGAVTLEEMVAAKTAQSTAATPESTKEAA